MSSRNATMITSQTQGRCQRTPARTIDSDANLLFVLSGAQISNASREKRTAPVSQLAITEENPVATGHGQLEHDTDSGQQQNKKSVAASQTIKRCTTHIACKTFVLPGKKIKRKANKENRKQQPSSSAYKAGMEGMC